MIVEYAISFGFICLFYILYHLLKRRFDIWEKKDVPFIPSIPILGNYGEFIVQKTSIGQVLQKLCEKFQHVPYFGAFYGTEPTLVVHDPETIKLVMTKDFYYFSGREISKYTHKEVLTQNIFFSGGDRWKVVRQNLTPLFSSSKMKNMFYLIENCCHTYEKMLHEELEICNTLEVRTLISRYTMECIGYCVFGVNTQTMNKDLKNNQFYTIGLSVFEANYYRGFKTMARAIWPSLFYGLGFKSFPETINIFFNDLLSAVFESRNYKPSNKHDFVDLILSFYENNYITGDSLSNMKGTTNKKVTVEVNNELLVAQCITFFAAGFDTSATTMSFTLYELAKNQEAQRLAQKEVDDFLQRHNNRLTYDCITELVYVEACAYEAMRLYPVLGHLAREVIEDYTLPSGLKLEKGLRVHIPVYSMHHNPNYFPEPEQYQPERFLPENKANIKPYTYFPFGEGPRICIGMRFAKMVMLAGLVTVLKRYNVTLAPGMPSKVDLDPRSLVTQSWGGVHLKFEDRDGWEQRLFQKETPN